MRSVIRQEFGVEHLDEITQYKFRLHGHALVERSLAHVAIDDSMLFPCLEIGVASIVIGQNLIRVVTLVTVYYAPVVGIGGLAVNHLIIQKL